MEVESIGTGTVEEVVAAPAGGVDDKGVIKNGNSNAAKRARYDRCFSFMEISIDPGVKSLKQLDSKKFKEDIKKWAKKVVAYARQLSDRLGNGSSHR